LVSLQLAVFWYVTPCNLIEICRLLEELVCPIFRVGDWSGRDATLKVATTHSSEISEHFYQTSWRQIPVNGSLRNESL